MDVTPIYGDAEFTGLEPCEDDTSIVHFQQQIPVQLVGLVIGVKGVSASVTSICSEVDD